MPPHREAMDLTGVRFGALVAHTFLPRATARGAKPRSWWVCSCDCGSEDLVQADRLRAPDDSKRAVRACKRCRSKPCIVCGEPFLKSGTASTCGAPSCRKARRNKVNALSDARHVEARNAHDRRKRALKVADPETGPILRAWHAARQRAYRRKTKGTSP